jgi:hypothetical protein
MYSYCMHSYIPSIHSCMHSPSIHPLIPIYIYIIYIYIYLTKHLCTYMSYSCTHTGKETLVLKKLQRKLSLNFTFPIYFGNVPILAGSSISTFFSGNSILRLFGGRFVFLREIRLRIVVVCVLGECKKCHICF